MSAVCCYSTLPLSRSKPNSTHRPHHTFYHSKLDDIVRHTPFRVTVHPRAHHPLSAYTVYCSLRARYRLSRHVKQPNSSSSWPRSTQHHHYHYYYHCHHHHQHSTHHITNQPIMALLNPVYGLIVPFLFVVTIPLAIFAGITTTLAFSVLMFRVAVVYIDIAVHMVPQYVTGQRFSPLSRRNTTTVLLTSTTPASNRSQNRPPSPAGSTSGHSTPPLTIATNRVLVPGRHHRRRRTSGASFNSVGSITPIDDNPNGLSVGNKRDSFMMASSIGMDRDFEGVGGWRLRGKHSDYDDAWAQLNSRLELPLDYQRRHHRSPSGGGATTPGGTAEYLIMKSPQSMKSKDTSPDNGSRRGREMKKDGNGKMIPAMSPNSSRQRTPTSTVPPPFTTMDQADGSYFPPVSPQSGRRLF